jgi:hypothetical protein
VTWILLRLGWGNIGAIVALGLLPLVALALDGPSRHESGMQKTAIDVEAVVDNTATLVDEAVSPAG